MSSLLTQESPSANLLGGKVKSGILHVLLFSSSKLNISELARQAHVSKTATLKAIPILEKAGLVAVTEAGRERQAELVEGHRKLVEQIVALDAPMLPTLQENMTDDDLERVALYFATPSTVETRDDDWHEDQRTLPVSSNAWEGRGELD